MKKVSGIIVDIENRRQFPGTVCFEKGKIVDILHTVYNDSVIRPATTISDNLPYILPGFIDAHIQLEMSQVSPSEYARGALSQGVIGAAVDCDATSAILGLKGVHALIDNAKKAPFYFGFAAPSTIHHGIYELSDIKKLISMPEVTHLGKIDDFPSVILHEARTEQILALAQAEGKPADGYAPSLSASHLDEYCKSSISTDHGCTSYEDALAKLQHHLSITIPTRIPETYRALLPLFDDRTNADKLMLSSGIIFAANIPNGYLNKSVAKAIENGADIYSVLRAACINSATHYHLSSGLLKVGDNADFIVVNSIHSFDVLQTYIKGKCVYDNSDADEDELGKPADISLVESTKAPLKALNRFDAQKITAEDIAVRVPANSHAFDEKTQHILVNIIEAQNDETCTAKKTESLAIKDGAVISDVSKDCIKAVLVSRYAHFAPVTAFVHGFKMEKGAIAISVSHDKHNIIAVGTTDADITLAVNTLIDLKGGEVYVVDGKIAGQIQFDFAGLLSTKRFEEYKAEYDKIAHITRTDMQIKIKRPIRLMTHLAETDIPTIKLSPRGLFNVATQELIPVVVG